MNSQNSVSIITCTHLPFYMDNIFANYSRQTYPLKELIIILNNHSLNIADWYRKAKSYQNVKIIQVPESYSAGACLNCAVRQTSYPYIANFDHDDYYGPRYLSEFMEIAPFSDAGLLGKKTHFVFFEEEKILALIHPGREKSYVDYIIGCTLFMKKSIFEKVQFVDADVADEQFGADCTKNGIKIFAVDKYNFAYIRRNDLSLHTYKLDNNQFMKQYCRVVAQVSDFRPWVNL
ncbi:glycosyltransferase [Candidatus Formimonas warabiya]|uniref:Glycosyl transferase n=1 Tax=Formimonas warabiya TaxID=1761012 RepID=A0A3G1KW61_FORW1|nr:glycosyltransferase [Candidatus Formimonas warabiya]ATW26660.1 glycosyl transferase [Candidatus Formimonas warabiya]